MENKEGKPSAGFASNPPIAAADEAINTRFHLYLQITIALTWPDNRTN